MIPIGMRYRSTLKGFIWRPVKCEHCSGEFLYKQPITAEGSGMSPLFLNNQGARSAAQEEAMRAFQKQAEKSNQPPRVVACPDCAKLQTNMVNRIKRNHISLLAALLLVLTLYVFPQVLNVPPVLAQILGSLALFFVALLFMNTTVPKLITVGLIVLGTIGIIAIARIPSVAILVVTLGLFPFIGYCIWFGFLSDFKMDSTYNPWKLQPSDVMRRTEYQELLALRQAQMSQPTPLQVK